MKVPFWIPVIGPRRLQRLRRVAGPSTAVISRGSRWHNSPEHELWQLTMQEPQAHRRLAMQAALQRIEEHSRPRERRAHA